jgi:hypothetical protein
MGRGECRERRELARRCTSAGSPPSMDAIANAEPLRTGLSVTEESGWSEVVETGDSKSRVAEGWLGSPCCRFILEASGLKHAF